MSFKRHSKAIMATGAFLFCTLIFVCFLLRDAEDSFTRPSIQELSDTALDGHSPYDKKESLVEGFWYGPHDGFAVRSGTDDDAAAVLVRVGPDTFPPYKPSVFSEITRWVRPDPIGVTHQDKVRLYGVYHARGWAPPGYILEDCGWLEVSRVEVWDSSARMWRRAAHWQ